MSGNFSAYQFEKSELWDAIRSELDGSIAIETICVLDVNTLGEARIHAAGRAAGLTDFKTQLDFLRRTATERG